MSGAFLNETTVASPPDSPVALTKSPYIAAASEALQNYIRNTARTWYKDGVDPKDDARKYAFQRLRETWFTPEVDPKFKLRREDKFYAIGSCFARGLESSLAGHKMAVESAAPEFAKLQPANKEESGLGFTNKYNTYSILNELRWALDPNAEFPRDSIVPIDKHNLVRPTHKPQPELRRLGRNFGASCPSASRHETYKEVSRGHSHSRACRGVARCSGRRIP